MPKLLNITARSDDDHIKRVVKEKALSISMKSESSDEELSSYDNMILLFNAFIEHEENGSEVKFMASLFINDGTNLEVEDLVSGFTPLEALGVDSLRHYVKLRGFED